MRNTSDRVTCDVPRTSIVRAAKNGLRVSVTAAAPSTTPSRRTRSPPSSGAVAAVRVAHRDDPSPARGPPGSRRPARRLARLPPGRPARCRSTIDDLGTHRRSGSAAVPVRRRAAQRRASSNAPISLTSGSSEMPAESARPAVWISRMSARTSVARAPGSATMKFACFSRHGCAAHPEALASGRLDQSGGVVALGVGEDAPAVRLGQRLCPAAPLACLVHPGADLGPHPPRPAERRHPSPPRRPPGRIAGTRSPRPWPPDGLRTALPQPVRHDPLEHLGHRSAVRSGVHPHRPARAWRGSRRRTPARRVRDAARRRPARGAGSSRPPSAASPSRATHR